MNEYYIIFNMENNAFLNKTIKRYTPTWIWDYKNYDCYFTIDSINLIKKFIYNNKKSLSPDIYILCLYYLEPNKDNILIVPINEGEIPVFCKGFKL